MTELPPEAAALLEQARRTHGPSQADRDRVLAGLHVSLGVGAASAGAIAATASAAKATTLAPGATGVHGAWLGWKGALLTWKAGKVFLATMAVGSAVGLGAVTRGPDATTARKLGRHAPIAAPAKHALAHEPSSEASAGTGGAAPASAALFGAATVDAAREQPPSDAPRPRLEPTASSGPAAAPLPEPQDVVGARPTSPAATSSPTPSTRRQRHTRTAQAVSPREAALPATVLPAAAAVATAEIVAPVMGAPRSEPRAQDTPAPVAPRRESTVVNELALVRSALSSIRDRDPRHALALLDEHAARFPSGALTNERRGLRVIALCAAGRTDEGRRSQQAFLEQAGDSPIAARVRGACHEDGP